MKKLTVVALLALASAARAEQTVEETRKNIRVLQGLPESQLFMAMNSVAQSLGVHCDYCHVKSGEKWIWESDEKRPKLVAREMMKMTRAITPAVTCFTCHRGSVEVQRVPPLPPHDPTAAPPRVPVALPSATEVVRRYRDAVGRANFKTMSVDVNIDRSQGRHTRATIDIAAPDKATFTITTPQGTVRQSVDGASAWTDSGNGPTPLPAEAAGELRHAMAIYQVMKVAENPDEMKVAAIERVGDRDTYAVTVRHKTYYFDVQTGLLLRELTVKDTLLAPLPEQVDYDDHRVVAGVKLPFVIRTSDAAPYDTAMRTVTNVRFDAPSAH